MLLSSHNLLALHRYKVHAPQALSRAGPRTFRVSTRSYAGYEAFNAPEWFLNGRYAPAEPFCQNAGILPVEEKTCDDETELQEMNGWLQVFGRPYAYTKTQAKKALRHIHVNLHDLLANPPRLKTYKSVQELRKSIRKTGPYPKRLAKRAARAVKYFLRRLF